MEPSTCRHGWTARNCISSRFWQGSSYRDCCRPREPAGNCLRSSRRSIRFSSDGRLLHLPSVARTAAWDERCSGVEERCALSPPGSAEEVQAYVFQWRRHRVQKRQRNVRLQAGSRPLLQNVRVKPKNLLAGWLPRSQWSCSCSNTVQLEPCDVVEVWLLRESQEAQHYTRLALCLEPGQASIASVSLLSQLARFHAKAMCFTANLSTLWK